MPLLKHFLKFTVVWSVHHSALGLKRNLHRICVTAGDEDVPHVPHREPERWEQAERGRETGREAHQQGQRHRLWSSAVPRWASSAAELRQKDGEAEGEGQLGLSGPRLIGQKCCGRPYFSHSAQIICKCFCTHDLKLIREPLLNERHRKMLSEWSPSLLYLYWAFICYDDVA